MARNLFWNKIKFLCIWFLPYVNEKEFRLPGLVRIERFR